MNNVIQNLVIQLSKSEQQTLADKIKSDFCIEEIKGFDICGTCDYNIRTAPFPTRCYECSHFYASGYKGRLF